MKTLACLAAAGTLALAPSQVAAASSVGGPVPAVAMTDTLHPAIASAWSIHNAAAAQYGQRWDDDDRYYDRRDRYRDGRRIRDRDRMWRGRDGRYYCEREDGTTGLVAGAVGGALLGRVIDRHGDRTVGTVLGAIAGGLLGREIDRGELRCR